MGEGDGAEHGELGDRRLHESDLVVPRGRHIHVEDVSARIDFREGFFLDGGEAACLQVFSHLLATGRIDAFADLDGGIVIADEDGLCTRGECSEGGIFSFGEIVTSLRARTSSRI